jgi:hypothetical protein
MIGLFNSKYNLSQEILQKFYLQKQIYSYPNLENAIQLLLLLISRYVSKSRAKVQNLL